MELANATQPPLTGLLTSFDLFPKLPKELRLEIWGKVLAFPHLIALQRRPVPSEIFHLYPRAEHHRLQTGIEVANASRKPPAILHVNQEARTEALKKYELRVLSCTGRLRAYPSDKPMIPIYYNPLVDIVYLNNFNVPITSLEWDKLFALTKYDYKTIPRVAVSAEWSVGEQMRALHGNYCPGMIPTSSIGCPGLKEVFFVVESRSSGVRPERIDENARLHPVTTQDLASMDFRNQDQLQTLIQRIQNDGGIPYSGENRWIGNNKPTLHMVRLA